ncbi:hypothetical protein RhiirA5_408057 [Rhizophagus irregularis]|uniref:Uncharacterized protein n=1 Tax=Rhizophagus irregularis TaxID=588596 RepID=A0A2I1DYS4_9GLOM|nr:hypothetical protein RhiirA5_408057 [Rhizophagus irregularis]PKC76229.1 hypothetical protein RhiirA1_447872 [Rhizophagus irregularis]PKY15023.1 hypothetical protein RhiirB3_427150 [Rhizophagus irregularis]CAB4487432.1 unnamed protein product [Rhizophagus irregularis]CAB5187971.1 unnamed protein product [Rhizophagus irregularis]
MKNSITWCLWCAVENRHTRTIEDMRKFSERKGGLCFQLSILIDGILLNGSVKKAISGRASAKDILKGTWCRRCNTPGRKRVVPNQKIILVQGHITSEQECTPIQRYNTQH